MHGYVGTEEGLNHFLPLKQNLTLPFYLDWLASELRGSPVSASHAWVSGTHTTPGFYVGVRDSSMGSCAYVRM